jgi:hypothetical protein
MDLKLHNILSFSPFMAAPERKPLIRRRSRSIRDLAYLVSQDELGLE